MPGCDDGARPVLSGDGTERAMLIGQAPGLAGDRDRAAVRP